MKGYKTLIIVLFFLSVFCLLKVDAVVKNYSLLGKVIYIDPGHGGLDPGALYKDIKEKDINLEISEKIKEKLEKQGATIYMTRYGDYDLSIKNTNNRKRSDLSRRAIMINNSECDLYLSIHLNSDLSPTWHGAQIFYDDVNPKNKELASVMEMAFQQTIKTTRESKEITGIYLYRNVTRPGILIEAGFLSNPNDRYLLRQNTYQHKIANAVVEGVLNYYS